MSAGSPTPPPRPRKQPSLAQRLYQADYRRYQRERRLADRMERQYRDGQSLRRRDPMQRKKRKPFTSDRMTGQRNEGSDAGTPRAAWQRRNRTAA